jgi:hypothetical protein
MKLATNLLHAAIAASLATAAFDAGAVALDARGVGQVLLYPYYTANGGNQTLLSVVNTTNRVKAVRVRFLEARNSKQALGFNLYLSPFDVWTAAVFAQGATGPASVVTFDTSCTVPRLVAGQPQAFNAFAYSGPNSDHPASLDATLSAPERTREGHIEMIEMGLLQTGPGATDLAEEATHVGNTPVNCNALAAQWQPGGAWLANGAADIDLPNGGLSGAASIVDVAEGLMVSYRAEALRQFYTDAAAPGALHLEPVGASPDLASANNGGGSAIARMDVPGVGWVDELVALPSPRAEAVSLVLMQSRVLNEFNVEPGLGAATEWVVTFPTKRFFTDVASNAQVRPPFTDAFRDDGAGTEQIQRSWHDREGRSQAFVDGICPPDISPPPQGCFAAFNSAVNVLEFVRQYSIASTTTILGSSLGANAQQFGTQPEYFGSEGFRSGWASVRFEDATTPAIEHVMVGPTSGLRYRGLPAIGFSAIRVINSGAQPGLLANYGGAYRHRGTVQADAIDP